MVGASLETDTNSKINTTTPNLFKKRSRSCVGSENQTEKKNRYSIVRRLADMESLVLHR